MSELADGLVVKEQSGFFWVELSDGRVVMSRLRGRLMEEAQTSDIAAIGDRVRVEVFEDGTGMIEQVEDRTSTLARAVRTVGNRGAGSAEREQVIVANADQAFFVFAVTSPAPSFRMLDRFLVAGEQSGIDKLVIIANKIDLDVDGTCFAAFRLYENIGYVVVPTSAQEGTGIDSLRDMLKGHISVFTGQSGVGKTSLLNSLQPGLARTVKSVGRVSQEGVHTTRDSALVKLDTGGYLADTPGMRSLTVWDVEPEELDAYYIELAEYVPECRFGDCTHQNEPGCAVRQAVATGAVSQRRYNSYLSLRTELEQTYAVY